ncbi:MAG: M23 family metallopeptidase [Prevotella sp.]|nr:M23 family metallopeptidase [Prevotella sp.]
MSCIALTSCADDSQESASQNMSVDYRPPVDYEIVLAGNFGEPRPYHFHGGLDIKTENVEGKRIYAVADGYVSRLTVNLYGFGNAVYVAHPDGLTSVYCHLQRFADCYEEQLQRTGRDTLSLSFPAGRFPVKAGDLIAISGNTGHSTGPHLHLELHDTKTWQLLDPMEKMAPFIADTVAPQAHSLMAIPMKGEGLFNGGSGKQTFGIGQSDLKVRSSEHTVGQHFTAWGRVGFALWADDYSEKTYNHYGIRHTRLLVDGREVFRSNVGAVPVSCHSEVNRWGDYQHWLHHRTWYMKSYREPGMRLPVIHTNFEQGIVTFDEERPYRLTYELRDYQGNSSLYHFTVHGRRDARVTPRVLRTVLNPYRLYGECLWPRHSLRQPCVRSSR